MTAAEKKMEIARLQEEANAADEHMETLRVVNPRAYEGVLRKLSKI